jgi:hypothetical protein
MKTILLASFLTCVACAAGSDPVDKVPTSPTFPELSIEHCITGDLYAVKTCTFASGRKSATREACGNNQTVTSCPPEAPLGCCTPNRLLGGLYDTYTCFYPIAGEYTGSTEASARAGCNTINGTWSAVAP